MLLAIPRVLIAAAGFLAACGIAPAHAAPVVYSFGGTGEFSLNGATPSASAFNFVFIGDSDDLSGVGTLTFNNALLGGTVSVDAFGLSGGLLDSFQLAADSNGLVSFLDTISTAGLTIDSAALAGYGLAVPFGPVTVSGDGLSAFQGNIMLVDNSTLTLLAVDSVSFTAAADLPATSVPEPAGLAVLAGAGAMLALRRRAGIRAAGWSA